MRYRSLLPVVGMALRFSLAVPLFAASGDPSGPHGFHGPHEMAALQLTDDQKTQMKAIFTEQHEQMQARLNDLRQSQRDLRAEVFADAPDANKIQTLQAHIKGLQADMLAAHVQLDQKIAAILTPDQRKTMATMPAFGMGLGGPGGWHHHHQHPGSGGDPAAAGDGAPPLGRE